MVAQEAKSVGGDAMKLTAVVHPEGDRYWSEIPSLPGCVTEADSLEELKGNLKEAAELWLEDDGKTEGEPGSFSITIEI